MRSPNVKTIYSVHIWYWLDILPNDKHWSTVVPWTTTTYSYWVLAIFSLSQPLQLWVDMTPIWGMTSKHCLSNFVYDLGIHLDCLISHVLTLNLWIIVMLIMPHVHFFGMAAACSWCLLDGQLANHQPDECRDPGFSSLGAGQRRHWHADLGRWWRASSDMVER